MRTVTVVVGLTAGLLTLCASENPAPKADARHPAIGSWYGKAVQVCGDPLWACPKAVLFMTPTLSSDGAFLGNDTFALGGPPFGPHTTAHGGWTSTSATGIVADYVFMSPNQLIVSFPSTAALRFRWQAEVVDAQTMVGYVNIYPGEPVPTVWESLVEDQFPTIPKEGRILCNKPSVFYKDPNQCPANPAAPCPLVFKFRVLRVQGE